MFRKNLEKTLDVIEKTVLENYNKLASKTNTDEGYEMVIFCRDTLLIRNEGNWGREEEEERIIGIDESGWIILTHSLHYGAGDLVIDNVRIDKQSSNGIVKVIRDDSLRLGEYNSFFTRAVSINKEYNLYL